MGFQAHLRRWCLEIAGRRVHGTTKRIPLEVFTAVEQPALQPLPPTPWEVTEWKRAKLHADCHVIFAINRTRFLWTFPSPVMG